MVLGAYVWRILDTNCRATERESEIYKTNDYLHHFCNIVTIP
jgi:hypothetical protein